MQDMDVPAAIKDADSTKEAQLLESWKAYKKGFQEGIALFNKKPKKGIAFMQVDCLQHLLPTLIFLLNVLVHTYQLPAWHVSYPNAPQTWLCLISACS